MLCFVLIVINTFLTFCVWIYISYRQFLPQPQVYPGFKATRIFRMGSLAGEIRCYSNDCYQYYQYYYISVLADTEQARVVNCLNTQELKGSGLMRTGVGGAQLTKNKALHVVMKRQNKTTTKHNLQMFNRINFYHL